MNRNSIVYKHIVAKVGFDIFGLAEKQPEQSEEHPETELQEDSQE